MNQQDIDRIASNWERAARLLRQHGVSAIKQTRDWQSPLHASVGRVVAGGDMSDPTYAAVEARGNGGEHQLYARLVSAVRGADIRAGIVATIVTATMDKLPENERAGIGHCAECGRHCDGGRGEGHARLKNGLCPACYIKSLRTSKQPDRLGLMARRQVSTVTSAWVDGREATTDEIRAMNEQRDRDAS